MPENTLDCQNLQCPAPLMLTKKLVESRQPARLTVLVDNEPAEINVRRYLDSQGFVTTVQREGEVRRLISERETNTGLPDAQSSGMRQVKTDEPGKIGDRESVPERKILVFIAANTLGTGIEAARDAVLGHKLMLNFLATLPELGPDLWRLVLLNSGVTLAAEGSPVLDKLQALEAAGVRILVCGACLEHYGLLPNRKVGETSNMLDIVTSMQLATSVIRI